MSDISFASTVMSSVVSVYSVISNIFVFTVMSSMLSVSTVVSGISFASSDVQHIVCFHCNIYHSIC